MATRERKPSTHHAAVGMAQQDGVSVEESPMTATLSSLGRAEKGRRQRKTKRVKLTKSTVNKTSCSQGTVKSYDRQRCLMGIKLPRKPILYGEQSI